MRTHQVELHVLESESTHMYLNQSGLRPSLLACFFLLSFLKFKQERRRNRLRGRDCFKQCSVEEGTYAYSPSGATCT